MAAVLFGDGANPVGQAFAAVQIVEADRNPRPPLRGDDVVRRVGRGDFSDFKVRRLKPLRACIQRQRVQLRQNRHQFGQRIIGQMRIGDVALRAVHGNPDIDRTAPPDLHHVAQTVD